MRKDKVISKIFEDVSKETGLPIHIIENIYESQWEFIYEKISTLDLDEVNEEEFNKLKTNFNIPALGKLFTSYNRIENVRRKSEINQGEGNTTNSSI